MSAPEHRWLDLIWTDLVGRSHVLRTTRQACEEDRVEMPLARLVQGFGEESQAAGKVELIPDWSSERALPWDSAVSVCIADVYEEGAPSPLCVRGFLRTVAEEAAKDDLV